MLRLAVTRVTAPPVPGGDPAPAWMGESERRRWANLPPAARRAFLASRALLRDLLESVEGVAAGCWDVSAEPGTAPILRSAVATTMARHASLSHRLGWVAAAVSDQAVGIDVECARPARTDPHERAALMLAPDEVPAWNALAPDLLEAALLTRWTAKEAWFKATPAQASVWDFRAVVARACAPERANVRVWVAPALHVAVCGDDALDLVRAECAGIDAASATSTFWHVAQA